MRTPSTHAELYAHHAASLRGERPPVFVEDPQCGWWQMRMVRGGPWVPVMIYCIQYLDKHGALTAPEEMRAHRGADDVPAAWVWPRAANKPITEDAYLALLTDEGLTETLQATHAPVDLTERPMRP